MAKYALPHLRKTKGSTIINMASVNHYVGRPDLLDYTSTKGAIVAFTRGLSNQVVGEGIRVNAIAPGPVWTPLVVATMGKQNLEQFNATPMGRPGQVSPMRMCRLYISLTNIAADRDRDVLCLPRQPRQQLHQRPDAASQRWNHGERLNANSFLHYQLYF